MVNLSQRARLDLKRCSTQSGSSCTAALVEAGNGKWIRLGLNTVRIYPQSVTAMYLVQHVHFFGSLSVFVGEVKNGEISGFHNWIQFFLEERAGNVDYRGYIKPRSRESTAETNDDDPGELVSSAFKLLLYISCLLFYWLLDLSCQYTEVLTLQFSWNGVEKFVGTSFIGTECYALY